MQRTGVNIYPNDGDDGAYIGTSWLRGDGNGLDDPLEAAVAAESVAAAIGGEGDDTVRWQRIRQEIEMPRTSSEIAAARGVSERQGRRDAAALRELAAVQAGLFEAVDEPEVTV